MKIKYTIKQVKPRIFFVDFKNQYDCGMTFLRYQEFYESPNPRFRGKHFTLVEYMDWYAKNQSDDGHFSYTRAWSGFNLPSTIVQRLQAGYSIVDWNRYDDEMNYIYDKCVGMLNKNSDHEDEDPFYIIGAVGKSGAMKHEIAHGLFFTHPVYREKMTKLVNDLKPSLYKKFCKKLKGVGYTDGVLVDECQAYFSTSGPAPELFGIKLNGETAPFIKVFKEFYKK